MNKEIRIINYVFKINNKTNLLSLEQYFNYQTKIGKIKLLYENEYSEIDVMNIEKNINKINFDNSSINVDSLDIIVGTYHLKLNLDNKELLNEYQKSNVKNFYKLFNIINFYGSINENEVQGQMFIDYGVLKTIPDEYYKLYSIDFIDFNGHFSFVSHDGKGMNLALSYKDEEYKNKKVLNIKQTRLFKFSDIKIKCSGHYLWTINVNNQKTFKSNPSIIPFKYIRSNLLIRMKKSLFNTDLKATSKDNLLITYKFR